MLADMSLFGLPIMTQWDKMPMRTETLSVPEKDILIMLLMGVSSN
jgi:hypothetical protein